MSFFNCVLHVTVKTAKIMHTNITVQSGQMHKPIFMLNDIITHEDRVTRYAENVNADRREFGGKRVDFCLCLCYSLYMINMCEICGKELHKKRKKVYIDEPISVELYVNWLLHGGQNDLSVVYRRANIAESQSKALLFYMCDECKDKFDKMKHHGESSR